MNQIQKKQDNNNKTGSAVAGVAGTAAIVGVAVAATIALKDEKTRKKVGTILSNVKDQAIDYVDTLKAESDADESKQAVKTLGTDAKRAVGTVI